MAACSIRGLSPMPSEQRMQNTAHRISSLDEDEALHDWLRSYKAIDAGWRCSINGAYVDEEDVSYGASTSAGRLTKPLSPCNWATSNGTDNESLAVGGPSYINPRLSLSTIPDISFIAPSTSEYDADEGPGLDMPPYTTFATSPSEHHGHSRQRSTSVSSTASRPMPARSILSSGSSVKTTCRDPSTLSVKFLLPRDCNNEVENESGSENAWPGPPITHIVEAKRPLVSPIVNKKRTFGFMSWLSGPSKKRPKIVAEQPFVISRPMKLCDAPRRSSDSLYRSGSSARSVRSVRSTRSSGSAQSGRSFWGKLA